MNIPCNFDCKILNNIQLIFLHKLGSQSLATLIHALKFVHQLSYLVVFFFEWSQKPLNEFCQVSHLILQRYSLHHHHWYVLKPKVTWWMIKRSLYEWNSKLITLSAEEIHAPHLIFMVELHVFLSLNKQILVHLMHSTLTSSQESA